MLRTENELRGAIPNRNYDLVAAKETALSEGLVPQTRQAQVANFDHAGGCDEDIGGFQVSMEDKVGVQEVDTLKELVEETTESESGDG